MEGNAVADPNIGDRGSDDLRKLLEAMLTFVTERDIDLRTAPRRCIYDLTGSR